jgi:hypothetical protein
VTGRLRLLVAAAIASGVVAAAPAAWAHSPTDFLKVSVGRSSTILLPPMTTLPGRLEVTISAPSAFRLAAVSAGPGWQTRLAPTAAVLDGRGAAGRSLLVSVTGTASRAGRLPLDVRVSSPVAPTETYHWRVTALAGYAQPVSSLSGAARPDAPVDVPPGHGYRLWPFSLVFAFAAMGVLVVRRPRSQSDSRRRGAAA